MKKTLITITLLCSAIFINAQSAKNGTVTLIRGEAKIITNKSCDTCQFSLTTQSICGVTRPQPVGVVKKTKHYFIIQSSSQLDCSQVYWEIVKPKN